MQHKETLPPYAKQVVNQTGCLFICLFSHGGCHDSCSPTSSSVYSKQTTNKMYHFSLCQRIVWNGQRETSLWTGEYNQIYSWPKHLLYCVQQIVLKTGNRHDNVNKVLSGTLGFAFVICAAETDSLSFVKLNSTPGVSSLTDRDEL